MNLSFLVICYFRDDLANTSIAGWKGYNATTSFWTIYFSQIYCQQTKYSGG